MCKKHLFWKCTKDLWCSISWSDNFFFHPQTCAIWMFSVPKLTWIPHSFVILLPIAQMCNHLCAPIIHICGQLGFVFWNLNFQILDLSLINVNELDYSYLSPGFLHLHWLGFWTCQYEHRISLFFIGEI
jgi:hypothetical protein